MPKRNKERKTPERSVDKDRPMDLFEYMRETNRDNTSPLAARLRPERLEEIVGQKHIIGENTLLYRAIKADKLSSVIFTARREPERLRWQK